MSAAPAASIPRITDIRFEPSPDSKYVKTKRMYYTLTFRGHTHSKAWDMIESHDAVAVLLFHREKQGFLLVRQFRPPVWVHSPAEAKEDPDCGFTYELCAGLVDKTKPLLEIVKEEIFEEMGYTVKTEDISYLTYSRSNVGLSGGKLYLYFAEIDESMRVSAGGGNVNEGEIIETFFLPASQAKQFMFDDRYDRPSSLSYSFMWFFEHYAPDAASGLYKALPSAAPFKNKVPRFTEGSYSALSTLAVVKDEAHSS